MRRRQRLFTVVVTCAALACACNQFYGLDPTEPLVEPDSDGDGFIDVKDNCVDDVNPTQVDADGDTVGDVCDNCPLVSNVDQADLGDGDDVGDACDPHPTQRGDCLLLFDSFHDPASFEQHWELRRESGDVTSSVEAGPNSILLRPAGTRVLALVPRFAGLVGVPLDVQLRGRGRIETPMTFLAIGSHITAVPRTGYWCGLVQDAQTKPTLGFYFYPNSGGAMEALSTDAVGDELLFFLAIADPTFSPYPNRCRVEYGQAEANVATVLGALPAGSPGVIATGDEFEVNGFAVYRFDPAATCAEPQYR